LFEEDGGITKANLKQLTKVMGVENPENITQPTELVRVIQNASSVLVFDLMIPCFAKTRTANGELNFKNWSQYG